MRYPLLAKTGALLLVLAMIMACLARISGLVDERRERGEAAVAGVEQSHAAAQVLMGPILQRSCVETWDTVVDKGVTVRQERRDFTLLQTAARLQADGRTSAEALHRGLYKVNAYRGKVALQARFADQPLQAHAEHPGGRVACELPIVFVAVSDVRGLRVAKLRAGGQELAVRPGTPSTNYASGFSATLPESRAAPAAAAEGLVVEVEMDIVGTRLLALVPAAEETQWTLASDWPHPSFGGNFLPDERSVRPDGFSAAWHLSGLATTAQAGVEAGHPLCTPSFATGDDVVPAQASPQDCLDTLGAAFIDPVNPYVLSDRAVKYALLFVLLTFAAVALIEVLSGRRVHAVQYLLVGLAQSVFFLLLLSLSEHLPFVQAYEVAALACAGLLGFYASAMLGRRLAGLGFGASIAALYGLLYALLQMEQNSLVIGSVMLFLALAAVMTLTRRIDWFSVGARLRGQTPEPTP